MSARRCVCGFIHDYGHSMCEQAAYGHPVTDHPPAIPAIQVKQDVCGMCGGPKCGTPVPRAWLIEQGMAIIEELTTPLGLSPEQPARCGGTET